MTHKFLFIVVALAVSFAASAQSFSASGTHEQTNHSWLVALTLSDEDASISAIQLNISLDDGEPYLLTAQAGTPLATHSFSTNADPLLFNSLRIVAWHADAEPIVFDGSPLLTLTLTPSPDASVTTTTCQRTLTIESPTLVHTDGTEIILADYQLILTHDEGGFDIISLPTASSSSTTLYDLSGRSTTTPTHHGLYITNGRKFVR